MENESEDNKMQAELEERLKCFMKAQLKLADLTYEELADKLTKMGWKESKASIASKMGRGSFSATFMIDVLQAIGRKNVNVLEL